MRGTRKDVSICQSVRVQGTTTITSHYTMVLNILSISHELTEKYSKIN